MDLNVKNYFEQGRRQMSDGRIKEAIHAFDLAIGMKIECADSFFNRGVCHYRIGNFRQAKEDLEAAALLGCNDASLWGKYQRK
jgi:tetratricopeptide (TPR) repeat protein